MPHRDEHVSGTCLRIVVGLTAPVNHLHGPIPPNGKVTKSSPHAPHEASGDENKYRYSAKAFVTRSVTATLRRNPSRFHFVS
jgi:hypothetical protein